MAKILFSADWHIKLGQKNVPKDWQKNRFRLLYKELENIADENKVIAHVIGGDIFDSVPSLEEQELFVEFLVSTNIPTFIFDGNHEATRKGKTFFEQLKLTIEKLNPKVSVLLGPQHNILGVDMIPYTDLKTFNPKDFHNEILLTHVRGNIEPHVKSEIDLELFNRWDLVIAGDLHSHSNSQGNIVYPGSPMTVTFHRNKAKTGVIVFDNEHIECEWIPLHLPQLMRKTVETEAEMVPTKYDHTIYELTGNIEELSKVQKANPLLEKKVVKRVVESQIDFSNTKTMKEELTLYLKKVKGIEDVDKLLTVYNDIIKEQE